MIQMLMENWWQFLVCFLAGVAAHQVGYWQRAYYEKKLKGTLL